MSRTLAWTAALALTAGLSMAGAASAAPCRDAKGHFAKCPAVAVAAAKPEKCRDAKGHFTKCVASAKPMAASTTAMAANAKPAAKK